MASEFDAEDLYESLPTASPTTHMLAGSFAGVMEHCVMYPVDSVKTRLQSLATETAGRRGVGSVLIAMVREEGLARPWRGMGAMAAGAGPAHALYFGSYEWLKVRFSTLTSVGSANHDTVAQGAAAAVATCFHDGIMTPAEVVKQRLQMYNSPFRSMLDCVRQVYRIEGIAAFYRSFTTQLLMNVPFQGVQFIAYERMQNAVNPSRSYDPLGHVISGGVAGTLAAAVTTPLDVCKTLLNTQEAGALERVQQTQISGMLNAAKMVYRLGGMGGFFQGVLARVLYQAPSTAICWSVYEFFKYFLSKQGRKGGNGDYITYDSKSLVVDPAPAVRSPSVNSATIALPPAARALV